MVVKKQTKKTNIKSKKLNKTMKGGSFLYTTHDVEIFYPRTFLGKLLPSSYASKSETEAPSISWNQIFNIPTIRFKNNGNYIIVANIYDLSNNSKNVFIQQRIQGLLLSKDHTIRPINVNELNQLYTNIKQKTVKATTKLVFKIYNLGNYKHKLTYDQYKLYSQQSSSSSTKNIFSLYRNKSSLKKQVQVTKDLVFQHIHTYYFRVKIK